MISLLDLTCFLFKVTITNMKQTDFCASECITPDCGLMESWQVCCLIMILGSHSFHMNYCLMGPLLVVWYYGCLIQLHVGSLSGASLFETDSHDFLGSFCCKRLQRNKSRRIHIYNTNGQTKNGLP